MRKIDEKSEEKISGGMNTDTSKIKKESFLKTIVDPKIAALSALTYGGPLIRPEIFPTWKKKKAEESEKEKKPEDALTNSQPQTEDKK